jgi:protein-S-isoprenylcysteine O-methyltransferase Ste14
MRYPEIFLRLAIPALWIAWIAVWIIAARNVKRERWRERPSLEALHGIPLLLCLLLLAVPRWMPVLLTARFAPLGPTLPAIGTAMVAGGLGFAVWARVHLGRNWSSRVVVKEDHTLIRTGPYRHVRHPIYSGLLLALGGTALAIGEWRGVLAFGFALLGIVLRIRAEEVQMCREFPEYERYRKETAALIPLLF